MNNIEILNGVKKVVDAKMKKARQVAKESYIKNKQTINRRLCSKIQCDKCGRTVIFNNLKTHQKSAICKKNNIILS